MDFQKSLDVLDRSGILLFPSDTVLGLGCDATNEKAVERLFRIKSRPKDKALLALVSDYSMLKKYVPSVPSSVYDLLEQSERPTTIIYPRARNIAKSAMGKDGSMAFRIPKEGFALQLVQAFDKPIIATSANISGEPIPENEKDVSPVILNQIDYIAPLPIAKISTQPSQIILLKSDGKTEIIRH
jgi:L-threonylcarbamoyladenylate synthase